MWLRIREKRKNNHKDSILDDLSVDYLLTDGLCKAP